MATFHFDLVAPEKLLFSGDVSQVDLPGSEGDFGVLAGHAPIVTTLRPGILVIHHEGGALRVVVNGGNCVWADVNWVHYLHAAFTPDLSAAPRWFRLKEHLIGGWYRRRERRAVRAARVVVTNSKRTTADVVAHVGVPAGRVRTVYYGADPAWAPPAPRGSGGGPSGAPG